VARAGITMALLENFRKPSAWKFFRRTFQNPFMRYFPTISSSGRIFQKKQRQHMQIIEKDRETNFVELRTEMDLGTGIHCYFISEFL